MVATNTLGATVTIHYYDKSSDGTELEGRNQIVRLPERITATNGLLVDHQIAELAHAGMIVPFAPLSIKVEDGDQRRPIPSYGLSSCGYDLRLGDMWRTYRQHPSTIDLRYSESIEQAFSPATQADEFFLEAGQVVLTESIETFAMPDDVFAVAVGKSTWARLFINVIVTPIEPGWCGIPTLEIANHSPARVVLARGMGICQLLFFKATSFPNRVYEDRLGRYQHQIGVTLARSR